MELTFRTEGEYQLPNLSVPESPNCGKYGMMRRSFLREHRKGIYSGMLLSGKLNSHLEEIDRQAEAMMHRLTSEMAKTQGVTESLKASDPMKWTGLMNNLKAQAEETILNELIYA